MSVTLLAETNGIKGSNLDIGMELIIPVKEGTNPNNMFMYTVVQGDTLYSIARKYGTTVKEIMDLNYFKDTNLVPGTIIRIPEVYTKEEEMYIPNYINYIVKKGDTLYSIAKNYDMDVELIIKDNALLTNDLKVGQLLRLRTVDDEVEECFGIDYTPFDINYTNYIVKKGDTLYSIAKKYNTSVSDILTLNNLTNPNLSINQELKIPTNNDTITYIVKKDDTLYSIAKKYNKTVDSIKNKNNLNTNNLYIGQKLLI